MNSIPIYLQNGGKVLLALSILHAGAFVAANPGRMVQVIDPDGANETRLLQELPVMQPGFQSVRVTVGIIEGSTAVASAVASGTAICLST